MTLTQFGWAPELGGLQNFFRHPAKWQLAAREKRDANMDKIPEEWILDPTILADGKSRRCVVGEFIELLLDDKSRHITSLDVLDLVTGMKHGKLTAVEVVTAFCKRAAYAHQLSGLLLEIRFHEAIEEARRLDEIYKKDKRLVGPLHGVPLTLKDQFHIKGLDTSMGFVGWIGTFGGKVIKNPENVVESELVRELRILGAIPIGKTTLTQSLWAPETNNNILGYTFNPCNRNFSAGGSSGGEGAMQALRGSAFGIATDIGGSVSMPASFQGVFSLKPSAGRISFKDATNTGQGQEVMPTVVGIMAHSVESLRLVFKSLLSVEPWLYDPYALPIPWRSEKEYNPQEEPEYKPAFGLIAHDGMLTPHPPITRALDIVKKALETNGHQLIDWEWKRHVETVDIHGLIARGDGCYDVYDAARLSGEPFVPEIKNLFPNNRPKAPLPLPEYEKVVQRMKEYRQEYLEYWMSTAKRTGDRPVEAVISPVTPYAGVLPGGFSRSTYTSSINVLDYAAVVIPVTVADKEIDVVSPDFEPLGENDDLNMKLYDSEKQHGAPAAIQLIGRRLDEERLLSLAQTVVNAINAYKSEHDKGC
ncbi:hypothetical protein AOCH_002908 [Aspergillus ochraceoroseus]|uniref:Amidase domain-containing protein n=1 Tax=Aspergillus ochraceoroseus TaxID=138278 RepID=A0A0F8XJZ4_9EURO|nr:hypothetical protein AOCH_002908 [Aspergillus ochraceoroseus]